MFKFFCYIFVEPFPWECDVIYGLPRNGYVKKLTKIKLILILSCLFFYLFGKTVFCNPYWLSPRVLEDYKKFQVFEFLFLFYDWEALKSNWFNCYLFCFSGLPWGSYSSLDKIGNFTLSLEGSELISSV